MRVSFDDDDLDGQFQRTLAHAYERAADLGEAFAVAQRITPADDQSWYRQWSVAARRSAQNSRDGGHGASAGEAFLRACEYFRQAMFYLRGDLDDPRVIGTYRCMRECFRQAAQLLPWDITAVDIPFQRTTLNGYLMAPPGPAATRPAVLFPAGYDSPAEEGYLYAAPALRRGYVVLSFEGPGQGGVLYEQRLYLRPDFEAVLVPVVDFALGRPEIDPDRLALIGRSFRWLPDPARSGENSAQASPISAWFGRKPQSCPLTHLSGLTGCPSELISFAGGDVHSGHDAPDRPDLSVSAGSRLGGNDLTERRIGVVLWCAGSCSVGAWMFGQGGRESFERGGPAFPVGAFRLGGDSLDELLPERFPVAAEGMLDDRRRQREHGALPGRVEGQFAVAAGQVQPGQAQWGGHSLATPIIESRVTRAASSASVMPSVAGGRWGKTR
jgi:hypothetical protein